MGPSKDEEYIQAIHEANKYSKKIFVVGARPRINAVANIVSHGDTTIEHRSEKWQRVGIVCPANSFQECAGVQHDSVANVKPCCAYLPEIASNNFINKVSGSGDMLPPPGI